jgi:hypothetical protein
MLFMEIIAVYTDIHTNPVNAKRGVTDTQADGTYSDHSALKG